MIATKTPTMSDNPIKELFAPVLCLVRIPMLDDAIDLLNRNAFGNSPEIFTGSATAAHRFRRRVQVGMVVANVPISTPMANHSVGAANDSFFGEHKVHGAEGARLHSPRRRSTSGRSTRPRATPYPTMD